MAGEYERNRLGIQNTVRLWGRSVLLLSVLSACSTVPDAVNPVEWYKGTRDFITGKDEPEPVPAKAVVAKDAKPAPTAENRKDTPKGLVADRDNAQYAGAVRREVTPTRPLARRAPAPGQQVAEAPAIQAATLPATQGGAPAAAAAATPAPVSEPPAAMARADQGPSGPVAMDMTPPPPANIPETVAVPGRPKRLQQQFESRLAESAQQVVRPGMVAMPETAAGHVAFADDAPIHLVPPTAGRKAKARAGGGKGMAAPQPAPQPAASFQVASLQFAGGAKLDRADLAALAEVARLYKQTKGVVRVIGYAPPAPGFGAPVLGAYDPVSRVMGGLGASQARADAVARELTRRGVPASKILVAADPDYAGSGQDGARIFLDVM